MWECPGSGDADPAVSSRLICPACVPTGFRTVTVGRNGTRLLFPRPGITASRLIERPSRRASPSASSRSSRRSSSRRSFPHFLHSRDPPSWVRKFEFEISSARAVQERPGGARCIDGVTSILDSPRRHDTNGSYEWVDSVDLRVQIDKTLLQPLTSV